MFADVDDGGVTTTKSPYVHSYGGYNNQNYTAQIDCIENYFYSVLL